MGGIQGAGNSDRGTWGTGMGTQGIWNTGTGNMGTGNTGMSDLGAVGTVGQAVLGQSHPRGTGDARARGTGGHPCAYASPLPLPSFPQFIPVLLRGGHALVREDSEESRAQEDPGHVDGLGHLPQPLGLAHQVPLPPGEDTGVNTRTAGCPPPPRGAVGHPSPR